eukprot:SAG11_NODE_26598_length_343_cov_0.692623_1_plen_21_part_01
MKTLLNQLSFRMGTLIGPQGP